MIRVEPYISVDVFIDQYEKFVMDCMTDKVKDPEERIHWATDELIAEAGEVKGVLAKARRKHGSIQIEDYDKLIDELGDVLWSLVASMKCVDSRLNLLDLMGINQSKLQKRIDSGISYTKKD